MANLQQPLHAIRKYSLLIATVLVIVFMVSTYLRPDFYPKWRYITPQSSEQQRVEGYTGTVIFPLMMYTHSTILLIGTALAGVVLFWIWAAQGPKWRNRWAFLTTVGGVMFLCSLLAGSSEDFSGLDKLNAVNVMDNFTDSDTVIYGEHAYHLVLGSGLPTYAGGLSYYYGLIVFQCDSVGIMCRPALVETWGTEDPIAGNAQDFRLSAVVGEIDVVFRNTVMFRYQDAQ